MAVADMLQAVLTAQELHLQSSAYGSLYPHRQNNTTKDMQRTCIFVRSIIKLLRAKQVMGGTRELHQLPVHNVS